MDHKEIVTGPELSKLLKEIAFNRPSTLGHWFELHRVYENIDHQRTAKNQAKSSRWEFNIPKEKIALYEETKFTDELGKYRMKAVEQYPAYTVEELISFLPTKLQFDDDFIRHIEMCNGKSVVYYKSKSTSFILGETIEDSDLKAALVKMIVALKN
jgi:hypothetical protein